MSGNSRAVRGVTENHKLWWKNLVWKLNTYFLLLKVSCLFISDKVYDTKNIFNFY